MASTLLRAAPDFRIIATSGAGDRRGTAAALWCHGKADIEAGDTASAQPRLNEALRSFQSFQMGAEMIGCLEDHARLAHPMGSAERAVCLNAAAAGPRDRLALPRAPRKEVRWQRERAALSELLGGSAFDTARSEGKGWDVGEAIRHALPFADGVDNSRPL